MSSPALEEVNTAIRDGAEATFAAQPPDGVFDCSGGSVASALSTVGAVSALWFADRQVSRGATGSLSNGLALRALASYCDAMLEER